MGRKDFWTSDEFLGVIVALAVGGVSQATLVKNLKRNAYALGVRASSRNASERIAFIPVYDPSSANIRRRSRPQDVDAQLIQTLALRPTQPTWIQSMTAGVVRLSGRAALTTKRLLPRD